MTEAEGQGQEVPWEMAESTRGLLQALLDEQPHISADGTRTGFGCPSWCSHAIPGAVRAGYVDAYHPVDANGKSVSGVVLYMLSHRGALALRAANIYRFPTTVGLREAKSIFQKLVGLSRTEP